MINDFLSCFITRMKDFYVFIIVLVCGDSE